jgi:ABC-type branched-subunit amino acid transport system substrate-binding protein
MAVDAAHGLRVWADAHGAALTIEDCGEAPRDAARIALDLAGRADVFFGPYGSGAMRAVAEAFADRPWVVWNHGGAAAAHMGARIVDVLGPAERYWTGLADVLDAERAPLDRVAILHADTGFGRTVAKGAADSLRDRGAEPQLVAAFDARGAVAAAEAAVAAGARGVIGCGRFEDDVALGRALRGRNLTVGLVACGVHAAGEALGDTIAGWFGPCQWLADDASPPYPLGPRADYPAAQALATGLIAGQAIAAAGSTEPEAVWTAARELTTTTFLGPFAVDADGGQLAHRPVIVRWVAESDGLRRRVAWRPAGLM